MLYYTTRWFRKKDKSVNSPEKPAMIGLIIPVLAKKLPPEAGASFLQPIREIPRETSGSVTRHAMVVIITAHTA